MHGLVATKQTEVAVLGDGFGKAAVDAGVVANVPISTSTAKKRRLLPIPLSRPLAQQPLKIKILGSYGSHMPLGYGRVLGSI